MNEAHQIVGDIVQSVIDCIPRNFGTELGRRIAFAHGKPLHEVFADHCQEMAKRREEDPKLDAALKALNDITIIRWE